MGCTTSNLHVDSIAAAPSPRRDLSGMDVPSHRSSTKHKSHSAGTNRRKHQSNATPKQCSSTELESSCNSEVDTTLIEAKPISEKGDGEALSRCEAQDSQSTNSSKARQEAKQEPSAAQSPSVASTASSNSSLPSESTPKTASTCVGKALNGLSAQDKADVARWRGFMYQGIPPPVLIVLMMKEGLKRELIPVVLEPLGAFREAERGAIVKLRCCLNPDVDSEFMFPPDVAIRNMRSDLMPASLIPFIFDGYEPAPRDAQMTRAEVAEVQRYRALLERGMPPVDVATLTDGEKASPRVVFLVFSQVPLPPFPNVVCDNGPLAVCRPRLFNIERPGTVTSICHVGSEPPPEITGPVIKDGHCFGLRQASDETNPTWTVHPEWDNRWHVCERRYSNHPEIAIHGTSRAYREIERRIIKARAAARKKTTKRGIHHPHRKHGHRNHSTPSMESERLVWLGYGLFQVRTLQRHPHSKSCAGDEQVNGSISRGIQPTTKLSVMPRQA